MVLLNVLNNAQELGYKKFYVNDINSNIINFYTMLQKEPKYLIDNIQKMSQKYNVLNIEQQSAMYYDIRDAFNKGIDVKEKTIYFYFLMKTGFNGIYRENSKGYFNVPFGRKDKIIINEEYLESISSMIQKVEFYNLPFEDFLDEMKQKRILNNSFVYCDPPYLPDDLLVYQKQMLYTKESFNHELFFELINKLKITNIMISMSESLVADRIYNHSPFKKIDIMEIIRVINLKKLFSSKEIAYINYEFKE